MIHFSIESIFIKLLIDKLFMLINWFKRELKLIGMRLLSEYYLSLSNKELRKKRKKYNTGFVPPFYYDLQKTFPEIMKGIFL